MLVMRRVYFLLLAAVVLVGLGRIALLPPFEGVDETAHYSRILAYAFPSVDAATAEYIDVSVYNYYAHAPMAQGWISNTTLHHKDPRLDTPEEAETVYRDYHRFFEAEDVVAAYPVIYRDQPATTEFFPSTQTNWQVQHPPAYYALLGGVARMTGDTSLRTRIFMLRAFGFLLACAAFGAAMAATARLVTDDPRLRQAAILGMFYPFMMPSFFNDLTRMGNDTLAMAAFCVVWVFLLRHHRKPDESSEWIGLGLACGFAVMVKATMLAPVAGIGLWLLATNIWRCGWRGIKAPAVVFGLAGLIAAKWYAGYFGGYAFNSSHSGMHVFLSGLEESRLSLADIPWFMSESLFGAIAHFSDWSSYIFAPEYKIVIGLPVFVALSFYVVPLLRQKALFSAAGLPVWTAGPLLAGVALHSVSTGMALGRDIAPTPAYYAHIAAPAFALMLGLGLQKMLEARARDIIGILGLMALGMTGYLFARQALLYGGCWWPQGDGIAKGACYSDAALLYARLSVLAQPGLALALLGAGFAAALAGLLLILRQNPAKTET